MKITLEYWRYKLHYSKHCHGRVYRGKTQRDGGLLRLTPCWESHSETDWVQTISSDLHHIYLTHVEIHILEPFFIMILNPEAAPIRLAPKTTHLVLHGWPLLWMLGLEKLPNYIYIYFERPYIFLLAQFTGFIPLFTQVHNLFRNPQLTSSQRSISTIVCTGEWFLPLRFSKYVMRVSNKLAMKGKIYEK